MNEPQLPAQSTPISGFEPRLGSSRRLVGKTIELRRCAPKKGWENFSNPANYDFNADIDPKRSIRIFGRYFRKDFDRTFFLGGEAVAYTFNLTTVGTVAGITEKTVKLKVGPGFQPRIYSLDIFTFTRRNCEFDAVQIAKENYEISITL